jgi:NADP-dependent 3-hydroxy acid dehydrogenase YdfG
MVGMTQLRWLITGASAGFGRTFAEVLLERGDQVVATARNLETVADLVDRYPASAQALRLDVTDPAQVTAAVEAAVAEGPVDVLVNNAGHGLLGALEELSDEQLNEVIGVNLLGALAVTRAVLPPRSSRSKGRRRHSRAKWRRSASRS